MTLKDADKIKEAIQNSDDFVGGSDDIIKVIDSVPEVVISTDTDTISRKAAIKEVSRDIPVKSWKDVARVVELMKIFANRIKQLPPAQPLNQDSIETQSSDLISRKATTEAIEKCHKQCCRIDSCGDEWIHYETTLNEVESIPPMPSNTSNALDALADAYKGRSNALKNQTKWNRMMLHLAELQLTYSPDWGANGQGDQKLYDFVTELIDEFSGWDVPDTNVGEMITKQQMIDVLERVKRTANDILYDGPVLMSYNDVLDSLINIVNFLPPAQPELIEKTAYIRGFEQGRTQGMIDAQGGKK